MDEHQFSTIKDMARAILIVLTAILASLVFLRCTISDCESSCALEPDQGDCKAVIIKYYYDSRKNKCREFEWGGCDGVIPFDTLQDCLNCECNG